MKHDAASFVPDSVELESLAAAAATCTGCDLHRDATQTVFGSGDPSAPLLLVGEQPGDREDVEGRAFVGPAGAMLWRCAEEAGFSRSDVYATNAVKHFKFTRQGTRRIHVKPAAAEIVACRPWLTAELSAVTSTVVVALGATAARALFGRPMPIASNRDRLHAIAGRTVVVTYHPSAVLRADDAVREIRTALVHDLAKAWELAQSAPPPSAAFD
jgi:uracil-DNA glycosylase